MQKQILALWAMLVALASPGVAADMGTAFTYQGRLGVTNECGNPVANGLYDLRFTLHSEPVGDARIADPEELNSVPVTNGLFTVPVDFGPPAVAFNGAARYLEIEVRAKGEADYTPLLPREAITPTPYALFASNAPWAGILGLPPGLADGEDNYMSYAAGTGLTLIPGADFWGPHAFRVNFAGGGVANSAARSDHTHPSGPGSGLDADTLDGLDSTEFAPAEHLHDGQYWKLTGNPGTAPAFNFLGTTDDQPLELRVRGTERVLRLEPTASPGIVNVLGGSHENSIMGGHGAVIGGGGRLGFPNRVLSNFGTLSGGVGNTINTNSPYAVIGGGTNNSIQFSSPSAALGGGAGNAIQDNAPNATLAGGLGNSIGSGATSAVLSGGQVNRIDPGAWAASLSGGHSNWIQSYATNATITGGAQNRVGSYAFAGVIGGGRANYIAPSTEVAVIAGGALNTNSASYSTIGGGRNNDILGSAPDSTVGGGAANEIQQGSARGTIAGGARNKIQAFTGDCVISGGGTNEITGGNEYATIGGGRCNLVNSNAPYAAIPGGREAQAYHYGQHAFASGSFAMKGDAQTSVHVLRGTNSGVGTFELFLDGAGRRMAVPAYASWTFEVLIIGRDLSGRSVGYQIRGMIKRVDDTTTLVGPNLNTILEEEVTGNNAAVEADDLNDALVVKVTSSVPETFRWVATVRTVEVVFPPAP